jgi:adenine-specific DNA-methyltransferase
MAKINKQKLELTWIGKNNHEYNIANIEPRILEEDPALSNCKNDPSTENMIIHGDNLLALKALLPEYEGKVKCIYIDPPYNTGSAFEHYDDNVEHSLWLTLMKSRFELLHLLLHESGSIFIQLDDSEVHYSRVLMDEIFGRNNYVNDITISTNKAFGFKGTSSGIFKQANHLLLFAKNKRKFEINQDKLFIEKDYDVAYNLVFDDINKPEANWTWSNINDVVAKNLNFMSVREAKKEMNDTDFKDAVAKFALENAGRVFQCAAVSGGAYLKRKATVELSKQNKDKIIRHQGDDMDYMFIGGRRVIFYKERLVDLGGYELPGEKITDIWSDISIEGLAHEGGVDFPKGKKPEKLIQRCFDLSTSPGDYVLDSFLGSGTAAAVAHKMNRKYIGVEMGGQAYTHCKVRLDGVVSGTDQSGISKVVEWKGGGAYKFYELAPSFIIKDEFGNPVIDGFYNDTKLIRAMCRLMNFTFKPSDIEYWKHGFGQGKNYLYVTTQFLTSGMVQQIVARLGVGETLIICPKKFEPGAEKIDDRITIKKIPQSVLISCHFGKKEYLLPIKESAMEEVEIESDTEDNK